MGAEPDETRPEEEAEGSPDTRATTSGSEAVRGSSEPPAPRPASSATSAKKDRVVQTRVPRTLEKTLKAEARRRRLTVSQLIRNVLEDTFVFVDGVVADVDQIVSDSLGLARNAGRNARRIARRASRDPERVGQPLSNLSQIAAWQEVVLNRAARCCRCDRSLGRGERAFAGMSEGPETARTWLCTECVERVQVDARDPRARREDRPTRSE